MSNRAKTFSLHWGSGIVEEEAQIQCEYHIPTIQLLKFTEGEAKGTWEIRFCHYKRALEKTPKLKKLLAQMVK